MRSRSRLNSTVRRCALAFLLLCAPTFGSDAQRAPLPASLPTPIESAQHTRISSSAEMHEYLQSLAAIDARARIEVLGRSVQGRPLEALVLRGSGQPNTGRRLVVMIVGSMHGAAEPAGGEAMLQLARGLIQGELAPLRTELDFVLIPNANPDGRDLRRRGNANRVNLNMDFVALTQPETVAVKQALIRFEPHIVLDTHESAIYKRTTLARQNYMTDFWAQFESTNNPAQPAAAREFSYTVLLSELIAGTRARGLPAQRYIGEITRLDQPLTNGGYTLRNLRNTAGINGALSFLVETRLDAPGDSFPSYRNIAERIQRQVIVLEAFVRSAYANRTAIAEQVDRLRQALQTEPVMLQAQYVLDEAHPSIDLLMTRIEPRKAEQRTFRDHRKLVASEPTDLPRYLLITAHVDEMAAWLARQGILSERMAAGRSFQVEAKRYRWGANTQAGAELTASRTSELTLDSEALLIDMQQPQGRSALLLLSPNSVSSVFLAEPYRSWLQAEQDFWIFPVQ